MMLRLTLLLCLPVVFAGCAQAPCALCYEDAWSREPFPGEAKQRIPLPSADTLEKARAEAEAAPEATQPAY